ncbi:uncharacterized protein [Clytia hemisphaerica]|uniref:Schwannomin interacting protein 1 C-terminal domain-containing protein n=1 Tax=Clytia hemisphaerica TaxID=252671 RepID=A0A7M6DML8_9CNID|eukprot:TCONS_00023652-protein
MGQECNNNVIQDLFKNISFNTDVAVPDLEKLKTARQERNNNFLHKLESSNTAIEGDKGLDSAAIQIQRIVRGFLGRKKYYNTLYDAFEKEEKEFYDHQEVQIAEGEILIESYKIEREIEDSVDVGRNRSRYHHANAAIIQRAWRNKQSSTKEKEHVCCSCFDDFPELYEYYKNTSTICFCCDGHRKLTNKERLALLAEPLDTDDLVPLELLSLNSYQYPDTGNVDPLSLTYIDYKPTDILNNNPQVEFFNEKGDEISDVNKTIVESVTDNIRKKYSVIEASKSVLKSLEILQEHNEHKKVVLNKDQEKTNFCKFTICSLSIDQLNQYIEKLEKEIADKNLELLKELMIRDDLFTKHEGLMMDADDLTKRESQRKR